MEDKQTTNQSQPTIEVPLGDKTATVTIDDWAEQANSSVRIQLGETVVLVTAVMGGETGQDFFPLIVDYEERYYAAGRILGSRFMRREGKPSDEAIITARLIDRAIRPLFPKELTREVQIVATCLSWDGENDPDVLGLLGASFALQLSDIPWNGPIGGLRIGRVHNAYAPNPTYEERENCDLDFVMAGVKERDEIMLNMIEAESEEVSEDVYEKAVETARPILEQMISVQKTAAEQHGKQKVALESKERDPELVTELRELLEERLKEALFTGDKHQRMAQVDDLQREAATTMEERRPGEGMSRAVAEFVDEEVDRLVHEAALTEGRRVDDRGLDEVRPLSGEVSVVPRTHGSGLFRRGQTTTLSLLTLGGPEDQKLQEGMEIRGKKRFMHHYNFPPYAPGEVKPLRGPGRREIGHGMLAEKALRPVIPAFDRFPYTIRIVTEVVSSNGSTSMASACSSSLALMDAGVPISRPVAGISMGVMSDGEGTYKVLTDIQGPEDHHGDMDFKVAGTKEGITAVQLDVKISGVPGSVFTETLQKAHGVRHKILDEVILQTLEGPRSELSPHAPLISTLHVDPSKIGMIIGPGGKVINQMIADYDVSIDIDDSGEVYIAGTDQEGVKKAISHIKGLTAEAEVGEIYEGTVKNTTDFGAFVEILPGQEGLVHISELAPYHVGKVTDIVQEGDQIPVKVIGIDEQGKIRLSLKQAKEADPQPTDS